MTDVCTNDNGGTAQNGDSGNNRDLKRNSSLHGRLAKNQWKTAVRKAKELPDPWKGYRLDTISEEKVTRYMYNPRSGKWKTDEIVVKMQSEPFAHGAMRECYRMKKLSKFSAHPDWQSASNYVAKRYMKEAGRQVYFQDVKLQMDAKLWGEEYNKHRPPKKVDFFQNYIIEFKHREESPLYCVEHLIEGEYIKYNSNSGFVSDVNRLTPHAFSHFTFERSQHRLIIVDIQGVGDLYTDPQMHTVDQKEYGEANLGTKGMALFFSSHICSPICIALGLTQFDLSNDELERLQNRKWKLSLAPSTRIHPSASEPLLLGRGAVRDVARDLAAGERGSETTVRDAFKNLSLSIKNPRTESLGYLPPGSPVESPGITMTINHLKSVSEDPRTAEEEEEEEEEDGEMSEDDAIVDNLSLGTESSERYMGPLEAAASYPSSIQTKESQKEKETTATEQDSLSILGLIHWELATYHQLGRLSQDQVPDLVSVRFHLETAAACTLPSALYTLAHIHLQLPHDSFTEISVPEDGASREKGMKYLNGAAEAGHRAAMIELARSLDTGDYLNDTVDSSTSLNRDMNWNEAVRWYGKALETPSGASDVTDTSCQATESAYPDYIIMARMAEIYRSGGHQLEKDPNKAGELYSQAADVAMEMMKGKLANKYYMLAEEAWGEVEEEEEEEEQS